MSARPAARSTPRPRRGRPKGSTSTTGDSIGAVSAHEVYPLRVLCQRLGIGSKGWRTLRDTGLPVRRVGKQAFVLGVELLEHLRNMPTANDTEGD